jgi:hypothetical protein
MRDIKYCSECNDELTSDNHIRVQANYYANMMSTLDICKYCHQRRQMVCFYCNKFIAGFPWNVNSNNIVSCELCNQHKIRLYQQLDNAFRS